ncbi:MAG TPA: MarR family transcriptional regulator [Stellaceae bacterium]
MPRALTQADYRRLAEFRYVLRQFLIFSDNAAAASDLTAQQHQALLAIKGLGGAAPVTAGALAERLGIRHHSAVGLIDRLARKALVRRQRGAHDRRQVLIVATAKADRLLSKLSAAHHRELRRLAPLLRGLLEDLARG